ncbi:MAG: glycoside hydrolase family 13 protein [Clostridia bacterium]
MNIEHHSRKTLYRSPFGAVPCGTVVRLRVAVESYAIPRTVECIINDECVSMYYVSEINNNRLYECQVKMPDREGLVWYGFRVEADGETAYYGNNSEFLGGIGNMYSEKPGVMYQITVYAPEFKTPQWMKDAVVYQIFPDRFCRKGDTPFHGIQRGWGEQPYYRADQFGGEYTADDFFGGNLAGIKDKLPYLKELGVSAVYLNPIFKAQSNHRYNTGDYETIDPLLGTNEEFEELAALFKENGIRLILDGVFSHTGDDSRYFNKYGNYDSLGAYQSKDSPYYDWYSFLEWPDEYESWWGFTTLPNTREMNDGFLDYIMRGENSIIRRWIKAGASGWRLDVADELPDEFIKELRLALKEQDSDAVLIGEVWEDASHKVSYSKQREFFWGKSLDSVMNYVTRGAVLDFLVYGNGHRLIRRVSSMVENYPKEALYTCLNLISSHDVPRALTVLSGAPAVDGMNREQQAAYKPSAADRELALKRMRLAVVLQMTIPGAPCIYYGDEAGAEGYTDPFNRGCFPWENRDLSLTEFHREMIKIYNENMCLRTGDFEPMLAYEDTAAYLRSMQGGKDVFGREGDSRGIIVAVNASVDKTVRAVIDLGRFGAENPVNLITKEEMDFADDRLTIELGPLSFMLIDMKMGKSDFDELE